MISGIVLAAGTSSRMGIPKQIIKYRGLPLLQHTINRAATAGLHELVVVLGHEAKAVAEAIKLPASGRIVVNPDYRSGQSSSLRLGLQSLAGGTRAAVIFLGDQPDLPVEAITCVLSTYAETGSPVVRAEYRGEPGHPVLLDRSTWEELECASGDRGAVTLLTRRPELVVLVAVDLEVPAEVDTPDDFRALTGNDPESA